MGYHTSILRLAEGLDVLIAHWDDWRADATLSFYRNEVGGQVVTVPGAWLIELGWLVYSGETASWFARFATRFPREMDLPVEASFQRCEPQRSSEIREAHMAHLQLDDGAAANISFSLKREDPMTIVYPQEGRTVVVPGDWVLRVARFAYFFALGREFINMAEEFQQQLQQAIHNGDAAAD